MRVLVACEFSGTVRDAFAKLGHDAWSCDILPSERPGNHIQDDVLKHLDKGWDLMIAHPPCTYITNAGAVHLYGKRHGGFNKARFEKGQEAVWFFKKLLGAPIKKIAVENPVPSSVYGLPPYTQMIQPWQFGHKVQKKTCLWLKSLVPLMPTKIETIRQSSKIPGNWFNKGGKDRQKNRAVTFQGIADAMAEQWGSPKTLNG